MSDPYAEALGRLFALTRFGEKLDLSTPRALNQHLGRPLSAYGSIIVAGTNGKGSTCAFLETLLRAGGLKTGLFTSPHLVSFRERIRIDGEMVSEAHVAEAVPRLLARAEAAGLRPSFFEATWALAAHSFAQAKVDVAIWEVGLGGRLDATNVCDPLASGVTSVGLDHVHVLGDTLEAIAYEKAAVFRAGRPAFTAATGEELRAIREALPEGVSLRTTTADNLPPLPLPGAHQRRNASLAVALARAAGVEVNLRSLQETRWPGRAERMGDVVLDCAHNAHAVTALAEWIRRAELGPLHLVFGAMADKDVRPIVEILAPMMVSIALVTPKYPRRRDAADLAKDFSGHPHVVAGGVAEALDARPSGCVTLVTGSCFLVGEARAHLTGQRFPERGLLTTAR